MLQWYKSDIGDLTKRIFFVLLTTFLLRVIFLFANYHYFSDLGVSLIWKALVYSIRIDIATVLLINGFLLLLATSFPLAFHRWRKIFLNIFTLLNGCLIILSVCDNMYFTYTQRRINYEVVFLISQSFTMKLVLFYCKNGWYWLLLLAGYFLLYRRIFTHRNDSVTLIGKNRILSSIIVAALCCIAIRGFESRPLSPSTVLLYFPSKVINLASNTGFNLLYSYYKGQKPLVDKNYFNAGDLDKQFRIFHQEIQKGNANKPNIVLLVMESFARDYLDSSSKFKAYTPFLDSLMTQSLVFRNAFNNGRESTHGLVAILASLPPFMQVPYYHSQYHAASIRGIGKILSENGYDCSFFLGDVDDSFGFKEFTHSIGINHYYSRKDFGDDRFYNGAWGIHDENFFLYAAGVLAKKRSPFFATLYNVSSHPPYIIPENLQKQFAIPGQNAAQNSVSYVDHAYHSFFEKIKNEKWFSNTIFIFIADHFLSPSDKKQFTAVNINAIPFFIYAPGMPLLKGNGNYVVQQLDVVPTILQFAGYNGGYMSFGTTVLNATSPRYAVQKMDYLFQIIDSSYVLGLNSDNDAVMYLYNYKTDTLLKKNLFHDLVMINKKQELENRLKAMIQRYNNGFQNNRLLY